MKLKLTKPIVFFDLETTGVEIAKDRIVEISILKIFPNGNKESKTWLVNPTIPIPEEVIKIHGITNEIMLEKGENIKKILKMFLMDCANCNLIVAHNIQFDENVIGVETIRNYGTNVLTQINTRRYCTMKRSIKRFSVLN